ncbi:MAG: methyltransferase [Acidobacteriota bacterium]
MHSSSTTPNAGLLMQLALAYRSSTILFAASDLGVFSALSEGPRDLDALAAVSGGRREPLRLVLDSLVDLGLLERTEGRYANSATADAFLVRGRSAFIGDGLKYAEHLYPVWQGLGDLVRSGRPPMAPDTILGDDKAKTRAFVYAMHERARGIGSVLPDDFVLTGRRRLLDVGGGPGTYSMALVGRTPGLTATVLDRPGVLEVTREIVEAHGFADRVALLPGDYLATPFGTGYDVALLSGMMHRETPDNVALLLRKTHAALDPGGLAIVSDVFFDDDAKNSPPFAISFALNMMLTSADGSAHAKSEMRAWMAAAGFGDIEIRDMPKPNPHTLVIGTRR